jgi:hypothetical protein
MFDFLNSLTISQKLISLATVAVPAAFLEAAADVQSFEGYTLKGVLIIAVWFLVKVVTKLVSEHRAEMKEIRDKQEKEFKLTIENNSQALDKVGDALEKQNEYFEAVTRKIVDKNLLSRDS